MVTAIIIIGSILLVGFFSGVEIAYITANRLPFEISKKKGLKKGKILSSFYDKTNEFMATTLVGVNVALVVYGMFMDTWLSETMGFNEGSALGKIVVTVISTLVILTLGEFIPKALFRINPAGSLAFFTWLVVFFKWLLKPIVWVMVSISDFMLKRFIKENEQANEAVFTRFDLEQLVNSAKAHEEDEIDRELFQNALYLNDVKVRDCMIPRTEIEAVDVNTDMDKLRDKFVETRLSRLLVYDGNLDEVLGYVHHRKILSRPDSIREIIMEIPLVPETMLARDLLNEFIRTRSNMAWVVDEYGGTSGIVTLEDILEEIFGEIDDEYDDGNEYIDKEIVPGKEYLFSGRLEISYLNEKYNLNLPEEEYQTLSGLITGIEESIPEKGKEIIEGKLEFVIEEVSETKIETVRIIRLLS